MIAAFHGLSVLVKFMIVGGTLFAIVASIAVYNESQKQKGEARVIERSQKQGKINAQKSAKAHEKARTPGAADRLLRDSCRDC